MFHQAYRGPHFHSQVRFGSPPRAPVIPQHHGFIPHPSMMGHPARMGSPQRLVSMGSPVRSPPRSPPQRLLSPQRTASPVPLRFGSPSRAVQFHPQNLAMSLMHVGSRIQMPQALVNPVGRLMVGSPQRLVHSPQRLIHSSPQRIIASPSRMIHNQMTVHSLALSTVSQPQVHIPQAQGYAIPLIQHTPPQMIYSPHGQMVFQPLVPKFSPSKVSTAKFNTKPNTSSTKPNGRQPEAKGSDTKNDRDDLDKRFTEALDRTKKIVEKFQKQERMTPSRKLDSIYDKMPQSVQERDQGDEEDKESDDQDLQEIALQYEDGYIYKGQGILPQQRKGFGVLVDSQENEVYAGFWDNNVYNGEGRLNNLVLEQLQGPINWKDMTSISNGWESYQGEFKDGRMEGKGVLKLSNGEYYQGQFQSGMIHGVGTFSTLDGQNIRGSWSHGIFQEFN